MNYEVKYKEKIVEIPNYEAFFIVFPFCAHVKKPILHPSFHVVLFVFIYT